MFLFLFFCAVLSYTVAIYTHTNVCNNTLDKHNLRLANNISNLGLANATNELIDSNNIVSIDIENEQKTNIILKMFFLRRINNL